VDALAPVLAWGRGVVGCIDMIKKFVHKLTRAGSHSYTITVPKEIVKELKWRERQKLEITYDSKKKEFKVKDWEK
jgi:bifunctional DNA-binding transcriptional regulator/antitoxin component of YhaV-PrlF toxin-antitoxin module